MDNELPSVEGQPLSLTTALSKIKPIIYVFIEGEMQVSSVILSKVKDAPIKISAKRMVVTSGISKEVQVPTKYIKSNNGIKPTLYTTENSTSGVEAFKQDAFHFSLGKQEIEQSEDLFKSLKFFLIVGRFLGIIPYSGVFKNPKSPAAIISVSILAVLTLNLVLGAIDTMRQPKRNAYEIAKSVRATIQFLWACLIYLNFLFRGKRFLGLFYFWAKTNVQYGIPDRHLRRDAILITSFVLSSAIMENAILHLEYIPALDNISGTASNKTIGRNILETYYNRSNDHWARIIKFHEIISIIAFFQHKCMLYGCNYMDIMIALFSRAIYFKFKTLYKLAYERLARPLRKGYNNTKTGRNNSNGWIQLAHDHKKLCDLLQEMENFFSPLIFGSYAVNIFYICVQLLDGLTVDMSTKSLVHSVYAPWSFLHIILRIYVVSICAARVNSYAHQIRTVLQECPIDQYNAEIARLDKKVTTGPEIGFTGLGCFVVTKPFILKIISVVFTFEIVLLQGAPSSVAGNDC